MEKITYYAFAKNASAQIAQLLVKRQDGQNHQEFTGKVCKTIKEAVKDMKILNCQRNSPLETSDKESQPAANIEKKR